MTRADICASDDAESIERLREALTQLGFLGNTDYHDAPLGVGLMSFRRGAEEVTVFVDAWAVDIAGPADAVREVLQAMTAS